LAYFRYFGKEKRKSLMPENALRLVYYDAGASPFLRGLGMHEEYSKQYDTYCIHHVAGKMRFKAQLFFIAVLVCAQRGMYRGGGCGAEC
jgi:hypothetical protein